MELGIYTFAENTADPSTGKKTSAHQRMSDLMEEIELAEQCTKVIPGAEMVRITNTGAEATMHSIRLARAFTKKTKIIKFDGGYHGAYDYVIDKTTGSAISDLGNVEDGILNECARKTLTIPFNDI